MAFRASSGMSSVGMTKSVSLRVTSRAFLFRCLTDNAPKLEEAHVTLVDSFPSSTSRGIFLNATPLWIRLRPASPVRSPREQTPNPERPRQLRGGSFFPDATALPGFSRNRFHVRLSHGRIHRSRHGPCARFSSVNPSVPVIGCRVVEVEDELR